MSNRKIMKQAQEAVRAGQDRQQVFASYEGQISRPLHLAGAIASVPHPELANRYRILNIVLVVLLVLAALSKVVMAIGLFSSFGGAGVVGMIFLGVLAPGCCAIEAARFNGQIYIVIVLLCAAGVLNTLVRYQGDWISTGLDIVFLAAIGVLALVIKRKVFPNMGLGGVKKDEQGRYRL